MYQRCSAILLVPALALGTLALLAETKCCAGPQEGHGGGSGHAVAVGYRDGFRGCWGGRGRYYGWGCPGVAFGLGLGCGLAYPYYGYYYDGYGPAVFVDPVYYGPGVNGYPPPGYPSNGSAAPGGPPPAGQVVSGGPGPAQPVRLMDANVLFSVRVPADAVVWFNGFKTSQTGPRREFASSGLAPGRTYTFDIRAQWTGQDGEVVDLSRRISVQGGERRMVDFTARPLRATPVHECKSLCEKVDAARHVFDTKL